MLGGKLVAVSIREREMDAVQKRLGLDPNEAD
jgi:hypothetical protein